MGDETLISWADHTFNPWVGCTKVSPACDGCYAEHLMSTRMGRVTWGAPGAGGGTRERTSAANWAKPRTWDRKAAAARARPFVFCASLADVFDNAVPAEWRRDLFDLIRKTPNLTWLLLTKRPGNIVKLFEEATPDAMVDEQWPERFWPRNAAIGCTVVTQEEADRDIPKLLAAKAALKPAFAFVSMEPLLGRVDIRDYLMPVGQGSRVSTEGKFGTPAHRVPASVREPLDWVITGGETDQGAHKARPSHPDWYRQLRDQCAAAGVAYHHKQNGEWAPDPDLDRPFVAHNVHVELGTVERLQASRGEYAVAWARRSGPKGSVTEGIQLRRVGKKAAGRALDGVVHDARPVSP